MEGFQGTVMGNVIKKYKPLKCALCGKFRKNIDLIGMDGEDDEFWFECLWCCSQADFDRYLDRKGDDRNETKSS